jgi:hypothetical protein
MFLSRCRRGGIGRRAGLKIQWPQGRVGSSPSAGTPKRQDFTREKFSLGGNAVHLERLNIRSRRLSSRFWRAEAKYAKPAISGLPQKLLTRRRVAPFPSAALCGNRDFRYSGWRGVCASESVERYAFADNPKWFGNFAFCFL